MRQMSLIHVPKLRPNAKIRLICFPYAGGNSSTFIPWVDLLPDCVELVVIQLPGRGARFAEIPFQTMNEYVQHINIALQDFYSKPFIFFGHSMGACVAYELILLLNRIRQNLPIIFFASACIAPFISRKKNKLHNLPDELFLKEISLLNCSSKEVFCNTELMELILPALRADFRIIETYRSKNEIIVPTRICVLAGDEDDFVREDYEGWFSLFKANAGIQWILGDHFFVEKNRRGTLEVVINVINQVLCLDNIRSDERIQF